MGKENFNVVVTCQNCSNTSTLYPKYGQVDLYICSCGVRVKAYVNEPTPPREAPASCGADKLPTVEMLQIPNCL
jgi:hypothetical protein